MDKLLNFLKYKWHFQPGPFDIWLSLTPGYTGIIFNEGGRYLTFHLFLYPFSVRVYLIGLVALCQYCGPEVKVQ